MSDLPAAPLSVQLDLALAHLREVRAQFRDTLKHEPASDWFVDVGDVLDHAGIAPADRLRVCLSLLAVARDAKPSLALSSSSSNP